MNLLRKYPNLVLIFLSLISILFNKSFLLNPFVLICLYFSFSRGLKYYIINAILMIGLALTFSVNYGFEIAVVVVTYLFSTCLFALLIRKPSGKYFSLITMNILFLISVLLLGFSLENILLAIINTGLQFVIIKSWESLMLSWYDDSHVSTMVENAIVISSLAILGTFLEPIGLISIRIVLLFVGLKLKNETGLLAIFVTIVYAALFLNFSFINLAILFIPLLLVVFLPKYQIFVYLVTSSLLCLASPTPIYLNFSFYASIIVSGFYIFCKEETLDEILDFFKIRTQSYELIDKKYLAYTNGQITALTNYINLVDNLNALETSDPLKDALSKIKENVCANCDHYEHCKLKDDLDSLFKAKISSSDKKLITQRCISPYKLTMAINASYKAYQSEQQYFIKCQEANQRYKYLIKSIQRPLKSCSHGYEKKITNKVQQKIIESKLHYYQFWLNHQDIEVVFNLETYEEDEKQFSEFIKKNLENKYEKHAHSPNILTSTIQVSYCLAKLFTYEFGVVSEGLQKDFNGDNYLIKDKDESVYIILCDGMGHGKEASKCSAFLVNASESHLQLNTPLEDMMKDLNNILLLKNVQDNYSTMDLCEINLTSLRAKFIKAGAFITYIIRGRTIMKVDKHDLPLGIVSECNFQINICQLEVGDIIVIVSDGIGERIEVDPGILLINPTASMSLLAKNIFMTLQEKEPYRDDCTIITIRLI